MSEPVTTTRQSIDAFWTKFLTLVKKRGARANAQRWCVPRAEGFAKAMQPRRRAELTPADIDGYPVAQMLAWENSGFSLDAAVRVGAQDRAGPFSEQGAAAAPRVPAQPSRSNVWNCSTPSTSSTACPPVCIVGNETAPRR